jgi:hypothetical protein
MNPPTPIPSETEQIKGVPQKPGHPHPAPRTDVNLPKERAEEAEISGRHKNTGQKDHKGAR